MEQSLNQISNLYNQLIRLYSLAVKINEDSRVTALFSTYLKKRTDLAKYIYTQTYHSPQLRESSEVNGLSYYEIVNLIVEKEKLILKKYGELINGIDKIDDQARSLLLQRNELSSSFKSLELLTSYYLTTLQSA